MSANWLPHASPPIFRSLDTPAAYLIEARASLSVWTLGVILGYGRSWTNN